MEFKEFKPRFKSAKIRQNPVKMKRRLKSRNISYHFKWNQAYLNRGLNLNRRSNSLNSATGHILGETESVILNLINWFSWRILAVHIT